MKTKKVEKKRTRNKKPLPTLCCMCSDVHKFKLELTRSGGKEKGGKVATSYRNASQWSTRPTLQCCERNDSLPLKLYSHKTGDQHSYISETAYACKHRHKRGKRITVMVASSLAIALTEQGLTGSQQSVKN